MQIFNDVLKGVIKNFSTKLPQRDAHTVLFRPRKGEVRDIPDSQIDDLYLKINIFKYPNQIDLP